MVVDAGFRKQALEEMFERLRIPSISTLAEHKHDVLHAADFIEAALRRAGMTQSGLIERGGHPMVFGEWMGAPGKPTLLLYGHYDVQPPDPLEEWLTPPFEPTVRGDDVFARSATGGSR
jgi:acetylornithine deacetylase/succinyl-diaminopimelate desuccinylase-like protein